MAGSRLVSKLLAKKKEPVETGPGVVCLSILTILFDYINLVMQWYKVLVYKMINSKCVNDVIFCRNYVKYSKAM